LSVFSFFAKVGYSFVSLQKTTRFFIFFGKFSFQFSAGADFLAGADLQSVPFCRHHRLGLKIRAGDSKL
jgi:hypothetical protein